MIPSLALHALARLVNDALSMNITSLPFVANVWLENT
jgi:hypothetical protein